MTVPGRAPVLRFHLDDSQLDGASNIRRVAVSGDIDLATAPVLRSTLMAALDGPPPVPQVLEVDLAGVGFLDSTGIGALIGVRNHAISKACQVQLTGLQPPVRRVLVVTGLLDTFLQPAQ
jgi:anti-sigma B factor antagonist